MEPTRNQSGDDERDGRKPYTRPELRPLGTRQQSYHPVLGDTGGDDYFDQHYVDYHLALHDEYTATTRVHHHHHHDDILVHDHGTGQQHDHRSFINYLGTDEYGAADHTHDDDSDTSSDRQPTDPLRADWRGSPVNRRLDLADGVADED